MPSRLAYVIVLSAAVMLAPFAIDLYLPAFPAIADGFATRVENIEATIAIYLAGSAIGQLVLGPIADAYGRRRVLVGGVALFIIASLLIGASETLGDFYFWRFLQALGGAGSVAVFPIARERFGPQESARVISYMMAIIVIAPIVAPILGGYVLLFAGWRAIFALAAAIGIAVLAATILFIRSDRPSARAHNRPLLISRYRLVLAEPCIFLPVLASGLAFAGLFAFVAGSPHVYITHFGAAPEHYGYLVALNAAAMVIANFVNGRALASVDPVRKIVFGALGLAGAGAALLFAAFAGFGLPALIMAVIGFFFALAFVETNAVIIALSVRPQDNGAVAALNGAFQSGAGAVGSYLVSFFDASGASAMAFVMAGAGVAVLLTSLLLQRGGGRSRGRVRCGAP
ncbi:MAG: multidrug effflux MFS transporter [Pseudomonadota bacterium]